MFEIITQKLLKESFMIKRLVKKTNKLDEREIK